MKLFSRSTFLALVMGYSACLSANHLEELKEGQQIIDVGLLELHVLPNLLPEEKLTTLKSWINDMMVVAYEDFDKRVGIVWDDYLLDVRNVPTLIEVDPVRKFVKIDGVDVEQFPRSIFSYPNISDILLQNILPAYYKAISQHVVLPVTVYMQTFVLRSLLSNKLSDQKQHVRWHQDPSEYDNSVADYTLVLMLSDPFDAVSGWDGGEILLKNGMPSDDNPAVKVTPKLNQAILFNNQKNSHLVTAIKNAQMGTTRDIVIINVYLKDPRL